MIKIKLSVRGSISDEFSKYRFQTPTNSGIWGSCKFTFNPLNDDYDWFVVVDDIPVIVHNRIEQLKCPKENTILVTTEPSSISRYGRGFAGQFNYLITNQEKEILPHKETPRTQTGIYWLYGKDYDDIIKDNDGINKTKLISTICSDKKEGHTLHRKRFDFTALLEKSIPKLERFGRGFNFIEKKYEAIDDYKFHVVIENQIGEHLWSEKLADAFLGFTVPIYCGAPNIYDYFPEDSIIVIDINDFENSLAKIKEIISRPGEYERRLPAVREARKLVIEKYNLLAMINEIVENAPKSEFTPGAKIYSRRQMRVRYLPDLFRFIGFRFSNFLKDKFGAKK